MNPSEIQASSGIVYASGDASYATDSASLRYLESSAYVQVPPSATLRDVLYQISQGKADAVVVADEASRLPLGLLTLRELLHVISFEQSDLEVRITDHDFPKLQEVDAKLMALAANPCAMPPASS